MQITINTLDNGVSFNYNPGSTNSSPAMPHMPTGSVDTTKFFYTTDTEAGKTLTDILTDFRKKKTN